jgi:hypothetical protein
MDYGDSEDFRKFVRMPRPDRRLDLGVAFGARFHRDRHFLRSFDLSAPVIE